MVCLLDKNYECVYSVNLPISDSGALKHAKQLCAGGLLTWMDHINKALQAG